MIPPADTKFELELAEAELREQRVPYEAAREARNALILRALREGVRQIEVARITGLTRARIAQLRR